MKIDDEDMNKIIEEVHRKDKFYEWLDIGVVFECE